MLGIHHKFVIQVTDKNRVCPEGIGRMSKVWPGGGHRNLRWLNE